MPEPDPLGDVQKAPVCRSVAALYPSTQPCHGPLSPCDANPIQTIPFNSNSAGRWFSQRGSKVRVPPELPLPDPVTEAVITTGPPNFSAPLVTSNACSRCTALPPS